MLSTLSEASPVLAFSDKWEKREVSGANPSLKPPQPDFSLRHIDAKGNYKDQGSLLIISSEKKKKKK